MNETEEFNEEVGRAVTGFMLAFAVIATTMSLIGIGRHNADLGFFSGLVAFAFWGTTIIRVQDN
jgi:hypothetical protein